MVHRGNVMYTQDLFRGNVTEHADFVFGRWSEWLGSEKAACDLCEGGKSEMGVNDAQETDAE